MDSVQLTDLFTVAHFIKARCDHGLKAGEVKNVKNYVFFEVEILDPKTRMQLCYLDKVCECGNFSIHLALNRLSCNVGVFTLLGFVQMTIWAREKHKAYLQEFREYPVLRSAIIPLFL
ncbi:Very-long-chain enoyl-CoA reductase [Bagarius yarrelli]|uniref:Very-long-chain enoyl-CoA reductase n=1 Tax=Bagarius yarrelli TaxID=175774 RepID=A0A556TIA6_BAGYA|nr:Very-long-chain enoyl-CoA reductase [Bagarius yarrelli]